MTAGPDDRPRVAVFRKDLLPRSETFIREQVLSLRRWRPTLVGFNRVDDALLQGIDHRLLRRDVRRTLSVRALRLARYCSGSCDPEVETAIRRLGPRLIHAHFAVDATFVHPVARRLGLPMVVTLHGYDVQVDERRWTSGDRGLLGRFYPRLFRRMFADPSVHFVAVSEAIRSRALEWGVPADRMHVRYIGVDLRRFSPAGPAAGLREPTVLFVGRLVEKKGADDLLRAMVLVRARHPHARAVIIGDGPMRSGLEAMARASGVRVEFLGYQPAEEVRRWMDRARVLCAPSVRGADGDAEGLPIAILEAGAMGVPVVTSAVGGATEGIRDGETGFAVSERRPDHVADRIVELLGDDNKASAMSVCARRFAKDRFDVDACTRSLERLFSDIALPATVR